MSLCTLAACAGHDADATSPTVLVPVDTTSTITTAPTILTPNATLVATVGVAVNFDATQGGTTFADPLKKGLSYSVSFTPSANGLSAAAGRVTGTPSDACLTTVAITATDGSGRTVTNTFSIVALSSDLVSPSLPATTFSYSDADVPLPAQFGVVISGQGPNGGAVGAADNTPTTNRTTNAGATLGRVLFYDRRLSFNDKVSCSSCHLQSVAFGDTARFSRGFANGLTTRHAMALSNARFYAPGKFFWDERAATLEAQTLQPIQNAVEMGMTLDGLERKLAVTAFYRPLFQAAFGSTEITSDKVALALAQFVRSLTSYRSKFDLAFATNPPNFAGVLTAEEIAGQQLFNGNVANCARCHGTNAQIADQPRNNGLDATVTDVGAGNARFKVPSLRNIALRAPYMHDGRFATLADVIEFYDHGVQTNANLDNILRNNDASARRLNLSSAQKAALVAFLRTLTDSTFITDPRFASPFLR